MLALALLAAATVLAFGVRSYSFRGEVLPGVRVLGADVGGESGVQAVARIRAVVGARLARPLIVVAGRERLVLRPDRVLAVDAVATRDAALRAARGSLRSRLAALLSPLPPRHEVAPVLRLRPAGLARLQVALAVAGRPPVSATVALAGLAALVTPAHPGAIVDARRLVADLERSVLKGGGAIRAVFRPTAPAIPTAAARQAAATVRLMLSGPVGLRFQGQTVGTLEPALLARLVRIRTLGSRFTILLDREQLARIVEPAIAPWKRQPVDATFVVHGDTASVVPARPGLDLDPAAALVAVSTAARSRAERTADLALGAVPADFTTADAQALGIRSKLVSYTTQMGPSSANRIWNVHLMARLIDGTLIRPGEVFSFNKVVGPRTAERGFREGQQIVGSLTLPSIGGGVCQTATTLFNDAFEAGLPILARVNHSFYISHYPLGRDATVAWGGPDFVFRNDLRHGILIKAAYTDSTLTFSFYSTPEGREVVASTGPQTNFTSPTMSYAVDPSAPAGSVRIVDGSGEEGFDVTVSRTVLQDRKLLRRDSFTSHYIPVGPTAIFGPDITPPEPYVVLPSSR